MSNVTVTSRTRVLFLCIHNSARSQMSEAFLRHYAPDKYDAYSGGVEPTEIHPLALKVMSELGIDMSSQRSKPMREYWGRIHFGWLITVCARTEQNCPQTFPGIGRREAWELEDPAAFVGSEEEKLQKFREIRDLIGERVRDWIDRQEASVASPKSTN